MYLFIFVLSLYRGKNMSSMAFSMYLFTRGEGPLKTTQDLFTQAQYFGEEGVRLYQCGRELTSQVSRLQCGKYGLL